MILIFFLTLIWLAYLAADDNSLSVGKFGVHDGDVSEIVNT